MEAEAFPQVVEVDAAREGVVGGKLPKYVFPWPAEALGPDADLSLTRQWLAADTFVRFSRNRSEAVVSPRVLDTFSPGIFAEARALGQTLCRRAEAHAAGHRALLKAIGVSPEAKLVETGEPSYYRFTQWIFLQLYLRGLVSRVKTHYDLCSRCGKKHNFGHVAACSDCQGELKAGEVMEWRADLSPYAEKLLHDLERAGFSPGQAAEQKEVIGRVHGCEVTFPASRIFLDDYVEITAFTTRIERIFGVTFILLDPYHPLLEQLLDPAYEDDVQRYRERIRKGAEPRISAARIGGFALNPANLRRIPILVSTLAQARGTNGVILGVPAHDKDLFELARRQKLLIREVIHGDKAKFDSHLKLEEPWLGDGVLTNSGPFTSLALRVGGERIFSLLSRKGVCQRTTRYRVSWLTLSVPSPFGAPVPMVHCRRCGVVPVPEASLPVELPSELLRAPFPGAPGPHRADPGRAREGEPSLESEKSFVRTPCPRCGDSAARDTQTIHPWLGTAWSLIAGLLPELAGPVNGFRDLAEAGTALKVATAVTVSGTPAPPEEAAATVQDSPDGSVPALDAAPGLPEDRDVFDVEGNDENAGDESPDEFAPESEGTRGSEELTGGAPDEPVDPAPVAPVSVPGPSSLASRGEDRGHRRADEPEDLTSVDEDDAQEESQAERLSKLRPFAGDKMEAILPVAVGLGRSGLSVLDVIRVRYLFKFLEESGQWPVSEPFARLQEFGGAQLVHSPRPGKPRQPGSSLDLVEQFGADALRIALLFAGPLDRRVEVSENAIFSARQFLDRIWHQVNLRRERGRFVSRRMLVAKHLLIHEVTQRLSLWKTHTAVAALMRFVRFLEDPDTAPEDMDRGAMRTFLILLSPFAPFLARELWSRMGETQPIETASWPVPSDELIHPPEKEFLIYLDGRPCDRMVQPSRLEVEKLESRALLRPKIIELLGTRRVERVVVVPGKLVSIIAAK